MHAAAEPLILPADLQDPAHGQAILTLLDLYAQDLMGGGDPLSEEVRRTLIPRLQQQPGALVLLAWSAGEPVGLAICFAGFSTFKARPLLNVHDLAVHPQHRGRGIGGQLLAAVEQHARQAGHCKITLEVRADNPASRLYERCGFDPGDPQTNAMSFLTKELSEQA